MSLNKFLTFWTKIDFCFLQFGVNSNFPFSTVLPNFIVDIFVGHHFFLLEQRTLQFPGFYFYNQNSKLNFKISRKVIWLISFLDENNYSRCSLM
jgi:hypothetical protein